jgi:hypothetical protein
MPTPLKFILIFIPVILTSCLCSEGDTTKDLNATIRFTGTQIEITNNDDFTWFETDITINGKYRLKGNTLFAGETYTVGIMQFADRDGNRFTPMMKPQEVSIWCELADGTNGFYSGAW